MSSDTAYHIRHTQGDGQKNTAFLDYIMKLSQSNLNRFIDILSDENQPHVAELFRYDQKGTIMFHDFVSLSTNHCKLSRFDVEFHIQYNLISQCCDDIKQKVTARILYKITPVMRIMINRTF